MGGLVHGLSPVVPVPFCRLGFAVATHTMSQGKRKAIQINGRERIVRERTVTPALTCLDYRHCSGVEEVVNDQGDRLGLYLVFFFFPLVTFSYLQVYCLNLVFFISSILFLLLHFSSLFYSRISRLFFQPSFIFILSCFCVPIFLQIHFDLIIAPVFLFCFVMLLFTYLSCLYCLPILSLSFPFFPIFAGFVIPCFFQSIGFRHILTLASCSIPLLDSTNRNDQFLILLSLSVRTHCMKANF